MMMYKVGRVMNKVLSSPLVWILGWDDSHKNFDRN